MSRGPGSFQRAILAYVEESKEPVSVESMRWALYEQKNEKVADNSCLPSKWNTSFGRAVKGLASTTYPALQIEKRKLASFEECVAHYPGKTLMASVRNQRQILLPALLEWTREESGTLPAFNAAQNEEFFLEKMEKTRLSRLRDEWLRLEALMRPFLAKSGSDELFYLVAKGKFLFQGMDLRSNRSFVKMAQHCCSSGLLPAAVADRLKSFYSAFISDQTAGALKLKSFVRAFAFVPDRGSRCSLKEDTKEVLHLKCKAFVEAMSGFRPAGRDFFELEKKYDKFMDKLFDHTVFQRYNFVRLAPACSEDASAAR
jgi:hypothetical protein